MDYLLLVNRLFKCLSLCVIFLIMVLLIISCGEGLLSETDPMQTATTTITNQSTTTPTTPLTSTIPTTTPTTTQATATLTKTAALLTTTPTENNQEQIRAAVIYMFVPEFKPVQELIPILLTVTNPEDSQWACDIPITFTDLDDDNNVVIWMINVTLNVGETKEILVWGITMGEGRWKVKVGFKTSIIFTS